jgi:hypothetical protein
MEGMYGRGRGKSSFYLQSGWKWCSKGLAMKKSEIAEYLGKIGKKGGSVKSKRKREASRRNLEKALSKRWGKRIRLFDRKRMK